MTARQASALLRVFDGVTAEHMDALLKRGLLTDLREAAVRGLGRVSRVEFRKLLDLSPPEAKMFEIWRIIRFPGQSGPMTTMEFRDRFGESRCILEHAAGEAIDRADFDPEPREVSLALVTPRDFGFESSVPYGGFCTAVLDRGFEYCPPETGPFCRLDFLDQAMADTVNVGMILTALPSAEQGLFTIAHHSRGRRLGFRRMGSSTKIHPDDQFMFVIPER